MVTVQNIPFLLNDLGNCPAIFTHINPSGHIAGFIAWEVPDNISLTGCFTTEGLNGPVLYNANDYLNNAQN